MSQRRLLKEQVLSPSFSFSGLMKGGWTVLNCHFKEFLILAFLVYLPIQLVMELQMDTLDLSSEDMNIIAYQLVRILVVELLMSLLELVAVLVCAVITERFVDLMSGEETEAKPLPFATAFYRGIRMWPRALVTYGFVVMGLVSFSLLISVFGNFLLLFLAPLMLVLMVVFFQYRTFACDTAALRGRFGFDALRYIAYIKADLRGKTMMIFALISLTVTLSSFLFSFLLGNITALIPWRWLSVGLRVLLTSFFSVVNLYGFVSGTLWFLHLEAGKMERGEADAGTAGRSG